MSSHSYGNSISLRKLVFKWQILHNQLCCSLCNSLSDLSIYYGIFYRRNCSNFSLRAWDILYVELRRCGGEIIIPTCKWTNCDLLGEAVAVPAYCPGGGIAYASLPVMFWCISGHNAAVASKQLGW